MRARASDALNRPQPLTAACGALSEKCARARVPRINCRPSTCPALSPTAPLPATATRCLSDAPDLRGKRAPLPRTNDIAGDLQAKTAAETLSAEDLFVLFSPTNACSKTPSLIKSSLPASCKTFKA
ncbi:hypothetical protein NDU88_001026 [Pleurodeles waltl]|uniref:Uncharacterized protein n=1 Tax=Pleurodeles waltl TaxID=8319 RepID=A0AAV7VZ05_PLEWA|nr:hypothetical protein NDU88_001026 [Pleurodeles waltl]